MTDKQRGEIARLIAAGYRGGKDKIDGEVVTWKLLVEIKDNK